MKKKKKLPTSVRRGNSAAADVRESIRLAVASFCATLFRRIANAPRRSAFRSRSTRTRNERRWQCRRRVPPPPAHPLPSLAFYFHAYAFGQYTYNHMEYYSVVLLCHES